MTRPERTPEWKENFRSSTQKIKERIKQAVGGPALVYYSAYPLNEDGTCVDNLDERAVEGRCIFVGDSWGGEPPYTSGLMENPTWLQVAVLANEMIKVTGDTHHVFLESLHEESVNEGVKTIHFCMGS